MSLEVRPANESDRGPVLALMPRLADFDLPESRNPMDLWRSDAAMFERWLAGDAPECFAQVAVDEAGTILGFTMVTMRPELLSHAPSAHLEAIAVGDGAEGRGVGGALLDAAEREAASRGAESLSLHVFARNERARGFYERSGYDGELMRYIKPLGADGAGQ